MSRVFFLAVIALGIILITVKAKQGYGPGEQEWGYIDVRTGAHMFYWLYYTAATVNYTDRPLAIWLQGGPGSSSTGYGNFEELGPLDIHGNYRNHTWVKDLNVLFIDNPVGAGFSYVEDLSNLSTNNTQIAWDLVSFMKEFYKNHPEFEKVPLHIFCESYGGKMAAEFALELFYAIQRGELTSNLTSVALGDPWISPIDSVLAWAPLLLNTGIVDDDGYDRIMEAANETAKLVEASEWKQALLQWIETKKILFEKSDYVDLSNILRPNWYRASKMKRSLNSNELMIRTLVDFDLSEDRGKVLEELMQGPVSKNLSIPSNVKWQSQSKQTNMALWDDFIKPVVHIVEELLNKTDLQIGVFSGQLDLICPTAGTVNWIKKMNWRYKNEYKTAPRTGFYINRILQGYEKSARNFTMFWINRAGHMVVADNPIGMNYILRKFTKYDLN